MSVVHWRVYRDTCDRPVGTICGAVVKRCPTCGATSLRVVDVKYMPKAETVWRTHRCLGCRRIILTEERVLNANKSHPYIRA